MEFSPKIYKAIRQSTIWHRSQVRKDHDQTPYIAHPFDSHPLIDRLTKKYKTN